jgi:integrase
MLLEHRAASEHSREESFVFTTRTGRALGQRNCLRALRATMKRARDGDDRWAFPALHTGEPVAKGAVPTLHSFRHSAASEAISAGDSVEEVSWQLGHRNSVVTRTVYLQQVRDAERQAHRRNVMEDRYGPLLQVNGAPSPGPGDVITLLEPGVQP